MKEGQVQQIKVLGGGVDRGREGCEHVGGRLLPAQLPRAHSCGGGGLLSVSISKRQGCPHCR